MYLGDFTAGQTVYVPWNTNAADGSSVAPDGSPLDGDIRIYKNSSTTQRTSLSGVTDLVSFDGVTGTNLIAIDLSDNTDAGFYAAGNDYLVMRESMTIDGQVVSVFLAAFSIQNRVAASPGPRRNVAYDDFQFYMTDSINHEALTGLVNGDFTKEESLDAAGFVGLTQTITEVGDGWYTIDLTAAEMNGQDIALRFAAAGADTTNMKVITVS